MKIKAAILVEKGQDLIIDYIDLDPPKDDEVLVQIKASGICHSDIHQQESGNWGNYPAVLGHEGAGIVAEVGKNVNSVKVGDKVALSWKPYCGVCEFCKNNQIHLCEQVNTAMLSGSLMDGTSRISFEGKKIHHTSVLSTFAEYAVVSERSCIKLPDEMPIVQAALLGCGVATGFGSAVTAAQVTAGSYVAVIGCGGVGVNSIQGARIAGASKIIAVDIKESNLTSAMTFGATHTVNATEENVVERIRELTNGYGTHFTIDTTGHSPSFSNSLDATRKGGKLVVSGIYANPETRLSTQSFAALNKTIMGTSYGSIQPLRDIRLMAELYLQGQLKLDELVLKKISLEDVNEGLNSIKNGKSNTAGRNVIVF